MLQRILVPILGLATAMIGVVGICGYALDIHWMYRWGDWDKGIAFPAAIGLLLIGTAVVLHSLPVPKKG